MGKSLFEFSKDKRKSSENIKEKLKTQNMDEDAVKKKVEDFSKLSEGDLMQELYKEVGKQKASGSFDANKLSKQLENVKPMLSEKQNANLEKILKNLK